MRTAGGFGPPGDEDYYNLQVRGWRSGHLYMSKQPLHGMLALADPYDPAHNAAYRLADASFYRGHYYLYFGAAPAVLIMAPYDLVSGQELGTTTTLFFLVVVGFLASVALWLGIRGRYFQGSAAWMGAAGVLVLGLATHVLALERRPLVWELPIACAYAASMLMLLCAWRLVERPSIQLGILTGLCLGVAVASRPTYIVGLVALVPVARLILRTSSNGWRILIAGAAGFALCIGAVLAHNYARFGDPLQFGQDYQLSGIREARAEHFSVRYMPHNAWAYFFERVDWSRGFPFLAATNPTDGPAGYLKGWSEAVCGICLTLPFLLLAFAAPWGLGGRGKDDAMKLGCVLAAITLLFASVCGMILAYFVVTVRYMADFTPALALLAGFGVLSVERKFSRRAFYPAVALTIALACLATVSMGILMSFDYHNQMLARTCPKAWHTLERLFLRVGFGPIA